MSDETHPSPEEIDQALKKAAEQAAEKLQADSSAVYLVNSKRNTLDLRATGGKQFAPLRTAPSFLAVPFKSTVSGRPLGVIRIAHKGAPGGGRNFSDEDASVLSEIAAQVALALEKFTPVTEKENLQEPIYKTELIRIELIAAINQEVINYLGRNPEALYKLDAIRFEELIAELLKRDGWSVDLTLPTRDGGYDIIAVSKMGDIPVQLLAQAKRYRADRPVGVSAIRELYAVKQRRHASKALLATTSYVSAPAKREFADVIPWELDFSEYTDLTGWLKRHTK